MGTWGEEMIIIECQGFWRGRVVEDDSVLKRKE